MGGLPAVALRAARPFCDSGKINREDGDSTLHSPCSEGNAWASPNQQQSNSRKRVGNWETRIEEEKQSPGECPPGYVRN